jgi:integrase
VAEITKGTGEVVLSPSTANSYLTSLSSLMAWAGKQGYVGSNPVSGMAFPDPVKNKDKRDPFLAKDLDRIFSAPIFTGMKSEHHWKQPGSVIVRGERFWIPFIALFTGMRLGEIINLSVDDIKVEDGIDCLIIRESKTEAGVRRMPIHPELKEMGLLGFVKGIQSGQPLFAGTSSDAYSKHFGRLLDSVGITDKKLVFHSFRHTFTDALRAAKVAEPITKALVGHSDGTVTGQYGSGYPVGVLYEELKRVSFPELVLSQHYQGGGG